MQLSDSIKRSWKEDTIIKSIIWNTIIEVFEWQKKIDIKDYLISIQNLSWTFLVKTTKPIINSELYLLNENIKTKSLEKLNRMWFKFLEFDIKYK